MISELLKIIESNNNYNEVFVAGATFSGTVLAIFFTLIALPIENILSKYSQDLIKRIHDWVFIGSFMFLGTTFIYNLVFIAFPATPQVVVISLGLSLCSVLVLALLVAHTFYLLDVRNQLNDMSKDIKGQIKKRVKKSEGKRKRQFKGIKKLLNLK